MSAWSQDPRLRVIVFRFYLAGFMVGVSVAVGVTIMSYIPSQGCHIIPLMSLGPTWLDVPAIFWMLRFENSGLL